MSSYLWSSKRCISASINRKWQLSCIPNNVTQIDIRHIKTGDWEMAKIEPPPCLLILPLHTLIHAFVCPRVWELLRLEEKGGGGWGRRGGCRSTKGLSRAWLCLPCCCCRFSKTASSVKSQLCSNRLSPKQFFKTFKIRFCNFEVVHCDHLEVVIKHYWKMLCNNRKLFIDHITHFCQC
jgi:hypothetical protein